MQMTVLKASVLAVLFAVSGCTTIEYVEVRPQCEPVPIPALPSLDRGELWDALGDAQYREVERYINGLWSVIDEQSAVLGAACRP